MSSIRRRLTTALLIGLGLVALLFSLAFYQFVKRGFAEEFDYALLAKARALTAFNEPGREGVNLQFSEAPPPEFQRNEFFQVSLGTNVLSRSPSLGRETLPIPPAEERPQFWTAQVGGGRQARAVALKFAGAGESDLMVVFARDLEPLHSRLAALKLLIATGALAFMGVLIAVVRSGVSYGLAPLQRLAAQFPSAKFHSQLSAPDAPVELRAFVEELNLLLRRLSDAFAREKRFAADAAHELATPIAELRAMTDIALKWPQEPEATERLALKTNEIARQMESSVRALLALARAESGQARLHIQEVFPAGLIDEALAAHEGPLRSKSLRVRKQASAIHAQSDPALLRAAIFNLVSNAVEYTPEGGSIDIALDACGSGWAFTIENDQITLEEADLKNIAEPFWRKDAARSASGHAGLGLALVSAYARQLQLRFKTAIPAPGRFLAQIEGQGRAAISPPA